MSRNQTCTVLAVFGVVVLAWLLAPLWGLRYAPGPPLAQAAPAFDAEQAFARASEFVTRNPLRVLGSLEARQSSGYIQQYLKGLGYDISYTHFDGLIAGRKQVGRNVLAFMPGRDPRILAVVAHYDTAPTTVQGAMDDGSGVGVMLELARVFAASPASHGILFIASDGEEWGMLGALDLAHNYGERERVQAVLSLDYVACGELASLELCPTGQMRGYTPPWLREIARRAVRAGKLPLVEPYGFEEHLDRALLLSWTDQGPFLNAGIPAIDLGSHSRDAGRERAIYHSADDTIDNLRVDSFAHYGRVAERILRTVDEVTPVPDESMDSFSIKPGVYIPGTAVLILHLLTFGPFAASFAINAVNHGGTVSGAHVRREVLGFAGALLPFLAFYYLISLARGIRLLPRYTLYPATPKAPILMHPYWGVLTGIFLTVAALAVGAYFGVRYLNRNLRRPDFFASRLILLGILSAVCLLALWYNSYWAVTFFVLPASLWAMIGQGEGVGGRAANRMWVIAAGIVYYMVTTLYAARLGLGWKLIWYEVLALSTGMFLPAAYLIGAALCAVGIRFVVIQSFPRPHLTQR